MICKLKSHVSPRGIIAPVSMTVHRLEALHLNRKSGVSRTAGRGGSRVSGNHGNSYRGNGYHGNASGSNGRRGDVRGQNSRR